MTHDALSPDFEYILSAGIITLYAISPKARDFFDDDAWTFNDDGSVSMDVIFKEDLEARFTLVERKAN